MTKLQEEVEDASRGRKVPSELGDPAKEALTRSKARETQKSFDKVNADAHRDAKSDDDIPPVPDVARGSAKETVSDKISKH